jgi:hypothetical protein
MRTPAAEFQTDRRTATWWEINAAGRMLPRTESMLRCSQNCRDAVERDACEYNQPVSDGGGQKCAAPNATR